MMRLQGLHTQRATRDINCSITGQLIPAGEACARWGDDVAFSAVGLRELLHAVDQTATDGMPRHISEPAVLKAGYTMRREGALAYVFHQGECVTEFFKMNGVWMLWKCAWNHPLGLNPPGETEAGLIQWFNDVLEPLRWGVEQSEDAQEAALDAEYTAHAAARRRVRD